MNKYRVKECFIENNTVIFFPQYRFLFFFWRCFIEKIKSPTYVIQIVTTKVVYFNTLIEAKKYISEKCNQVNKVKHKTVYHKV